MAATASITSQRWSMAKRIKRSNMMVSLALT
jgi:hypothetical protein